MLDHYPAVQATEGFRSLPRGLVERVAGEAVARHAALLAQLRALAGQGQQGPGQWQGQGNLRMVL